jgi:LmbE family N-acetylglucosaminyl deacetylase
MGKIVLVVAAHPDDEILGCGGTLARHVAADDIVHIIILADGETSRGNIDTLVKRTQDAERAAAVLGVNLYRLLGLPDNRLDQLPLLDIVQLIEPAISEIRPTIVYTHHGGDLNIDHKITHRAVLTACRPLPDSTIRAIYTFETPSSTEWSSGQQDFPFTPIHIVDISKTLDQKMAALGCYASEMRAFPHARSYEAIESMARFRGAQFGLEAAEVFGVIRQFWRIK